MTPIGLRPGFVCPILVCQSYQTRIKSRLKMNTWFRSHDMPEPTKLSGLARQRPISQTEVLCKKISNTTISWSTACGGLVVLPYKCLATPWHDYSLSEANNCRAYIESFFLLGICHIWPAVQHWLPTFCRSKCQPGWAVLNHICCSEPKFNPFQQFMDIETQIPFNLHPKQLRSGKCGIYIICIYIYILYIYIYLYFQDGSTSTHQPISHVQ